MIAAPSSCHRSGPAPTALRLTGKQLRALKAHLFPGDGKEAVALALCGRGLGPSADFPHELACARQTLVVHRIVPVAYSDCSVRTPDQITWSTDRLPPLLLEAAKKGMAILKIHSHPRDYRAFSSVDDDADRDLFPGICAWIDDGRKHASAVMLPDGRIFARTVTDEGIFTPITVVSVAGDDIAFWYGDEFGEPRRHLNDLPTDLSRPVPDFALRTSQAFGAGTVARLSRLSIAVIGASGTGSPAIEMLARLGVGELVNVDDDVVERKNLNRIVNATGDDATNKRPKVEVLARAVRAMDLGTRFIPIVSNLWDADVVRRVTQCDIVVGCMDTKDGRDLLNRLAAYYNIPYFDVGVRLDADGLGGIDQICGTVHYLQPDGSSLVSRGVLSRDDIRAAALRRTDQAAYEAQVQQKYLRGVQENRPAVISVNMLYASLAVNELLARLHRFRDDDNREFAAFGMSLTQARLIQDTDGEPCPALAERVGRGDVRPLLGIPELSVTSGSAAEGAEGVG